MEFATYDQNGRISYLIKSDKWKEGVSFDHGVNDWRHIVSRHISEQQEHPIDGTDDVDQRPSDYHDDPDEYPHDLSQDEIINLIKTTVEEGTVNGDTIEYSGSELRQFGVKTMEVIRDRYSGRIQTAYPTDYV